MKKAFQSIALFITAALILIIVCPFVLIIGIVWWNQHISVPSQIRASLPEKIQTLGVATNDIGISLPGGDCGGISFKLSEQTLKEIETRGLAFFDNATPDPVTYRTTKNLWKPWRESPVTSEDSNYAHIPNGCVKNFDSYLKWYGYKINRDTKGYYTYVTSRGYMNLWIFPEWGIIVYSYYY